MECQELQRNELAEKYLNGQLDPARQDDFEVHILECAQCLQHLEAVQGLREELVERAHQIRAFSQVEHFRFRWKLTVAAFAVLACAMGVVQLREMQSRNPQLANKQVQMPAADLGKAPVSPTIDTSSGGVAPAVGSSANAVTQKHTGALLSDSHKQNGSSPKNSASTAPSGPASGQNIGGQLASNPTQVDGAVAVDVLVTEEELYRLGAVQAPPPYTFSGLASFPEHDLALKPGALLGKHGKSTTNQARPYFRDAMNAYIEKRYAEATDLLEQAAKTEPNAQDVNFFLGVCRLLEAKPADSVTPLQEAFADQKSPWAQAAHFYLAKAYIQTGDLAQAEEQLQAAAAMQGRLKAEAGSELTRLQAIRSREEKKKNPEVPKP